jgi:hypothetical protein
MADKCQMLAWSKKREMADNCQKVFFERKYWCFGLKPLIIQICAEFCELFWALGVVGDS